jgi:hypothetical protein
VAERAWNNRASGCDQKIHAMGRKIQQSGERMSELAKCGVSVDVDGRL